MEDSGKTSTAKRSALQTGAVAGRASAEQAGPLDECGEIATTRLCIAFSDALKSASEHLFARGTGAASSQEQLMWLTTADFARNRRQDMVDRLRKHFGQRYALSCRRKSALLTGHVLDFDVRRLQVVAHDLLESGLDSAEITEAIRNGSWGSLHELTKWFRETLSDPELNSNDMPLGPRLIGGVVSDAINDQFGSLEIKQRLLRALCRSLPEPLDRIYRDLLNHLVRPPTNGESASHDSLADAPSDDSVEVHLDDRETVDGLMPANPEAPKSVSTQFSEPPHIGQETVQDSASNAAAAHAGTSAADAVIDPCLASRRLPRFIAEFLGGPWRTRLAEIHRKQGPNSPEWGTALRTMDELIWSLRYKKVPEERARMVEMLPDLVKRLGRGLETQNEPIESHHRFFAHLAECHIKILGASRPAEPPHSSSSTALQTVPPTPARAEATPAAEERGAPEHIPEESPLDSLEPGAWLSFNDQNLPHRKLKLGWVSPNRKLFLLTNHLGERALSLGARDLDTLLREGGARIISAPDATLASNARTPPSQDKRTA